MSVSREELKEVLEELLEKKIEPLRKSIEFLSAQYDEFHSQLKNNEMNIKVLTAENKVLKSDAATMKRKINDLEDELDAQEQYSRRECLEFRGLPVASEEDTNKLVCSVASLLQVQVAETDISVSHRLPTSTTAKYPPAIIAKFVRRDTRDRLYKARKSLHNLRASDLGFHSGNKMFISESLSHRNRELFKKALQLKRDLGFKFIWTNSGRIYLRMNTSAPVKLVSTLADLDTIRLAAEGNGNAEANAEDDSTG